MNDDPQPRDFLRLPAVVRRTGLSKSEIYRRISEARFPPSRSYPGSRLVFWPAGEIDEWQNQQLVAA